LRGDRRRAPPPPGRALRRRRPGRGDGQPRRGADLPRGRLRADATHDPLHRQAARRGCARAAAAPRGVAFHARRPGFLLMRRLIFVTQKLDPNDPVLAATVPMVRALAARVDELVVLCDSAAPGAVPPNARVREFGAPRQAQRGARFAAALAQELRPRPAGVVAHMVPLYAVLAAPLVRPLRIPLVLWYTHWKGHAVVRAAEKVCTAIASVDARSFPLPSRKVHAIGHGI